MSVEWLNCESCYRTWSRVVKRGRKPSLCPNCVGAYYPQRVRVRRPAPPKNLVIADGGKVDAGFGGEKNDCTVRTLAVACGVPYVRAYEFMRANGRKRNRGINFSSVMRSNQYTVLGKKIEPVFFTPSKGLKTALERNPQLRTGVWVIHSTHHVAVLKDGILNDSFDSSRKIIDGAYRVTGE